MFIFMFKQYDIKFIKFYIIFKHKKHFNSMNDVISSLIYFDFFFLNSNLDAASRKINN